MDKRCDFSWEPKVSVPVIRVGKRWEYFYGGDVPVEDGAQAVLRLDASSITDPQFLERTRAETVVKVLEEGAPLLVALSDPERKSPYTAELRSGLFPLDLPAGTTRLVQVRIGALDAWAPHGSALQRELLPDGGGMWFKFKGMEKCELMSSAIDLPAGFAAPCAKSVNHAVTLLSRSVETHRISHTGNAFRRVFALDGRDGRWYPLESLRLAAQAQLERDLERDLWEDVVHTLRRRTVSGQAAGARAGGMA